MSDQTRLTPSSAADAAWHDVDAYLTGALVTEDAVLAAARESSVRTTMPHVEVTPAQGAFLALLAQVAGARRVLELGTLAGYSTIWFARAVGESGRVVTLELEESNAAVARENLERAGVGGRVDVVTMIAADPSLEATALQTVGTKGWDGMIVLRRW